MAEKRVPKLKKKNRVPEPDSLAAALNWDLFAGDPRAFQRVEGKDVAETLKNNFIQALKEKAE